MTSLITSLLFASTLADSSEDRKEFNFTSYDENFAKRIMLPVSAAAYAKDAHAIETCLKNAIGNVTSRWDYGGNVLFYFHDVFHTLWGKIENHFYNYVHQQPGWDVWISGHSLGGALATLATSYLVEEYKLEPEKVKLVTFGQPRVGNRVFAERFDARESRREKEEASEKQECGVAGEADEEEKQHAQLLRSFF
ncbi:triacylglycerol lipase [Ancylostoma ceylanicum]|uniref:Triacylglycerol lipase n=1 Tax=Ancylostoma ceylanicum TaxID=53326 RepID=A0A0D6M9W9_9BILA|nr:triacylglycerol lipase [Ancylostoma ceylanicum]